MGVHIKQHDNMKTSRITVGKLLYLTNTRPDIAFVVGLCTRFNSAPQQAHLDGAHQIFRYLKGTVHLALLYRKGEMVVPTGFSDSDYQGDLDERRSTSVYAFSIGSSLTSWRSKLQMEVSMSTCEAEYRALADAASKAAWLRGLLEEVGMPFTNPITIHCDIQSSIKLAKNPVQNARTKHIERQVHFVQHHIKQGRISLNFVKSKDQLADILTKPLTPQRFKEMRETLGLTTLEECKNLSKFISEKPCQTAP